MPETTYAVLSVIAMLLSPLVALQIRSMMEHRREKRQRKEWIFKTLMSTRATTLNVDHVNALNLIDLDFKDRHNKYKKVLDAWEVYRDHLGDKVTPENANSWNVKSVDLLAKLLLEMGNSLGYDFNDVQIRRGIYYPQGFQELENKRMFVLDELCKVLKWEKAVPIFAKVVDITNEEVVKLQNEVKKMKEITKEDNAS